MVRDAVAFFSASVQFNRLNKTDVFAKNIYIYISSASQTHSSGAVGMSVSRVRRRVEVG